MNLIKKYGLHLSLLLGLLAFDQVSKFWSTSFLDYRESFEVIENFFWIHILRNTGGAWSMFSGMDGLFMIIPPAAFAGMCYFYFTSKDEQKLFRFSLIFLMAGTLGNFIDRIQFGYVRDFLSFNIFGYMFPVFNVADIVLNVGVGLLILETILEGKK